MEYEAAYKYQEDDTNKDYVFIRNSADPIEIYKIRREVYERGRIISTCQEWLSHIIGINRGNGTPPGNFPWWIQAATDNLRKLYRSSHLLETTREVAEVIHSYELCVDGVWRSILPKEMKQIVGAMHYINQNKLMSHHASTIRIEECITWIERTIF